MKEQLVRRVIGILGVCFALLPARAGAETWTVLSPNGSGSASQMAGQVTNQIFNGRTQQVQNNLGQDNSNGREQKASDASNNSNAGMAAAVTAGTGMVAAAIPMLASIDPVQVAAGSQLMAQAGLEFGQAIASGNAGKKNQGQQNQLTQNNDGSDGGEQQQGGDTGGASPQSAIASQLAGNQDLVNLLQKNGVNPASFIQNLASGNLTSPQAVLQAAGNQTPVSPDDLAKGIAQAGWPQGTPEGNGTVDIPHLTNDDNAKGGGDMDASTTGQGGGGGTTTTYAKDSKDSQSGDVTPDASVAASKPEASGLLSAAQTAGGREAIGSTGRGVPGMTTASTGPGEEEDLLAGILAGLGMAPKATGATSKKAREKALLAKSGVIALNPHQNIFQLAHRNYRSFQKWRKQTRVAAR